MNISHAVSVGVFFSIPHAYFPLHFSTDSIISELKPFSPCNKVLDACLTCLSKKISLTRYSPGTVSHYLMFIRYTPGIGVGVPQKHKHMYLVE